MARNVVIVGGGVIGLACAHHLVCDGHTVTVIDRDPRGDKASIGNAGGIAATEVVPASMPGLLWRVPGWLLDPLGPLSIRPSHAARLVPWLASFLRAGQPDRIYAIASALAALNSRAHDDWLSILSAIGVKHILHQVGALAVYETEAGFGRDQAEWDLRRSMGIECEPISGAEARRLEPALGPIVIRAVWTPQWSHVSDPRLVIEALLTWLQQQSALVVPGEVTDVQVCNGGGSVRTADGRIFSFDNLIIAAGAWSGRFAQQLGDRILLESERGYNMTLPAPGLALGREIIFAERKFVAAPLACGLRVGGAAEFAGLEAPPNYARSRALALSAKRYLPDLNLESGVSWMGHRPATPDSLPVIGRSRLHTDVFYAFGHGHLGLTQAATTGRLIAELIGEKASSVDLFAYRPERFA